ncbi:hypothetical protein ABBQ38_013274 [Trebouxia sp. C0009 RCD-2024]
MGHALMLQPHQTDTSVQPAPTTSIPRHVESDKSASHCWLPHLQQANFSNSGTLHNRGSRLTPELLNPSISNNSKTTLNPPPEQQRVISQSRPGQGAYEHQTVIQTVGQQQQAFSPRRCAYLAAIDLGAYSNTASASIPAGAQEPRLPLSGSLAVSSPRQ